VERQARRYTNASYQHSPRIEYLDLIQEGNEAILIALPQALQAEQPVPYLVTTIKRAMQAYCRQFQSAIRTPLTHDVEPYVTESLDCPCNEESESTLLDELSDTLIQESVEATRERDYTPLYEAVAALKDREYTLIVEHYGLNGCSPTALVNIERAHGWPHHRASSHFKPYALRHLYIRLVSKYSRLASPKGVIAHQQGNGSTIASWNGAIQATEKREEQLDAAYETLMHQYGKVRAHALARQAHVDNMTAGIYLQARENRMGTSDERLALTYHTLQAQGEKITVRKLAKEAHVDHSTASQYLKNRSGEASNIPSAL